jgi:hypothetical protein
MTPASFQPIRQMELMSAPGRAGRGSHLFQQYSSRQLKLRKDAGEEQA